MRDAERACTYIAERVRLKAGVRWQQGAMLPPLSTKCDSPAVRLFAEQRLWRIERAVAEGLVAWADGARSVELTFAVPAPRHVLSLQARGWRCVSLLDEGVDTSPHEDGLAFALHDLCHLEKFVDPEHHVAQVGFFRALDAAVRKPAWATLEQGFDADWEKDFVHVAADMNGSPVFLFAALKMKLKMAVRRAHAKDHGRPAPTGGPLDFGETRAYGDALGKMLDLLDLDGEIRDAALEVSTKRDEPEAAIALVRHFTDRGAPSASEARSPSSPGVSTPTTP